MVLLEKQKNDIFYKLIGWKTSIEKKIGVFLTDCEILGCHGIFGNIYKVEVPKMAFTLFMAFTLSIFRIAKVF